MKRLALVIAAAAAALTGGYATLAAAQPAPSTLPQLNATQQAEVQRQMDLYRTEIDGRVARGEITVDEASRLLKWREWQIAQQVAGYAPRPGPIAEEDPAGVPPDYTAPPAPPLRYAAPPPPAYYPPYYAPYYAPYYYAPYRYAPYPYYWGSLCVGGWGHHVAGRFCI
jgi:hypothetical protein